MSGDQYANALRQMRLDSLLEEERQYIFSTYISQRESITGSFHDVLSSAAEHAVLQQQQALKGPIKFLCISYLYSSVLTGTWDIKLDLYDHQMYNDETEAAAFWPLPFLGASYQRMKDKLEAGLRAHQIRVKQFEINNLFLSTLKVYSVLVGQIIEDIMKQGLSLSLAMWDAPVQVLYGDHLNPNRMIQPEDEIDAVS